MLSQHKKSDVFLATLERVWTCGDLSQLARALREGVRSLVDAQGITLVVREGEFCHYVEEEAIGPLWKGRRFPLDECISGWCMRHRRQAVVPDIRHDGRIPQDAYRATFVRALVLTPIRTRDPIGAIGAYWDHRYEPAEGELRALQGLADAAAAALAQACAAARRKPRVLAAETVGMGSFLRDALGEDAVVVVADTHDAAARSLETEQPDLVIVGYHFDGTRPYRLVQHVREHEPGMPILLLRSRPLLTGSPLDGEVRASYLELGADEYLALPDEDDSADAAQARVLLRSAVRALLAARADIP